MKIAIAVFMLLALAAIGTALVAFLLDKDRLYEWGVCVSACCILVVLALFTIWKLLLI